MFGEEPRWCQRAFCEDFLWSRAAIAGIPCVFFVVDSHRRACISVGPCCLELSTRQWPRANHDAKLYRCFACKQPVETSQVNCELLQELSGVADVCCLGSRPSDLPFSGMSSPNTYLAHLKCTSPQAWPISTLQFQETPWRRPPQSRRAAFCRWGRTADVCQCVRRLVCKAVEGGN